MKKLVLALSGTALLVAAVTYTVSARHDSADAEPAAQLTLAPGQLLFRDTATGRVGAVPLGDTHAKPQLSALKCDRFAVAERTAVCLAAQPGTLPAVTDVFVLDDHLGVRHTETLPGTPSRARVSPDGKRVAFKKKAGEGAWRLSVLDLASLRETELAETRSVDDQALWQDDHTVLYGLENAVWAVPADGSGAPRKFLRDAASPAVTG